MSTVHISARTALLTSALLLGSFTYAAAASPDTTLQATVDATRSLIRQGKIEQALRNLANMADRSKNDPEAGLAAGELFQELAAFRADRLQAVAPESAAAHELLGESFESQGKLDEARAEYQRALDKNPNTAGLHFLLGNLAWKLKKFDAAEAELRKELQGNPHHGMANLRMGQILLDTQRDRPLQAVAFLREAAVDAKSSLEAHRELGKALRLAHEYPEAVKELQFVEARNPNDESVHAQLAALYKDMGDRERSRQEIEIHARILREKLEASQKAHARQTP